MNRRLLLLLLLVFPTILRAQNHDIWTMWQQRTIAKINANTGAWVQFGTGMIDPARPNDAPGAEWTTIAYTPDDEIYVARRHITGVGQVDLYRVPAGNIVVTGGIVQNLQLVGPTGLCDNVDGLTAGPDGNIYLTSYNAGRFVPGTSGQADQCKHDLPAANALWRFNLSTGLTELVGTFIGDAGPGGKNSFYTDLAFDPLPLSTGGDLVGIGKDNNGQFGLYTIPKSVVLTGMNVTFPWTPFSTQTLTGGRLDGVAFDPTNGDLFLADDAQGVSRVTRAGANPVLIAGTSPALGWDLANRVRGCSDTRLIRILCVPGHPGDYTVTFEITNHSGKTMTSFSMPDPLPATVSPHTQPFSPPLANNASQLVTVTIHGTVPGQVVCLKGVMVDRECPGCCKFSLCVTSPECRCIQVVRDSTTCNPNGSFTYTFVLQNLSAQPLGALFIHPPAGVTISPDYIALTPPIAANGGIDSSTHTITVTGATPGQQLCFDVSVLDGDLNACCTTKLCIDVPSCGREIDNPTNALPKQAPPPEGVPPPL